MLIDIVSQTLLIELNSSWTRNIPIAAEVLECHMVLIPHPALEGWHAVPRPPASGMLGMRLPPKDPCCHSAHHDLHSGKRAPGLLGNSPPWPGGWTGKLRGCRWNKIIWKRFSMFLRRERRKWIQAKLQGNLVENEIRTYYEPKIRLLMFMQLNIYLVLKNVTHPITVR